MNKFNRFLYSIPIILSILSILSCPNHSNDSKRNANLIDNILGDKLLNEETKEIRNNNFEDFRLLTKDNLRNGSVLYEISEIKPGFYSLNQKKMYLNARLFSAILKIDSQKVVNYKILDDFQVIDQSFLHKCHLCFRRKFWKL